MAPTPATRHPHKKHATTLPAPSIKHLMMFVTLSAVAIAVTNSEYRALYEGQTGNAQAAFAFSQSLSAILAGAELTCMWVLLRAHGESRRLLRQPGHWVIWIAVITMALHMYGAFVARTADYLDFTSIDWTRTTWTLFQWSRGFYSTVTFGLLPLALCGLAAIGHRGIWRRLFLATALVPMLSWITRFLPEFLGPYTASYAAQMLAAIPPLAMFIMSLKETSEGVQRDWVHWVGIGVTAVWSIIGVVSILAVATGFIA